MIGRCKNERERKWRRGESAVSCILLLRKASVFGPKYSFSSLYVLATLTRGPDDTLVSLKGPLHGAIYRSIFRQFMKSSEKSYVEGNLTEFLVATIGLRSERIPLDLSPAIHMFR